MPGRFVSPCRINRSGTGRRHFCSVHHADLVESYRLAVEAQQARAEQATNGYETELRDYFDPLNGVERRHTFREWMLGYRAPAE